MLVASQNKDFMFAVNLERIDCLQKKSYFSKNSGKPRTYALILHLAPTTEESGKEITLVEPTDDEDLVVNAYNHFLSLIPKGDIIK